MGQRIKGDKLDVKEEAIIGEILTPATPPTGQAALYVKADKELYLKDDVGAEKKVGQTSAQIFDTTPSGSITVLTGTAYWHPVLTIDAADTYTVDVGGTLLSAVSLTVDGSLVANGSVHVLMS